MIRTTPKPIAYGTPPRRRKPPTAADLAPGCPNGCEPTEAGLGAIDCELCGPVGSAGFKSAPFEVVYATGIFGSGLHHVRSAGAMLCGIRIALFRLRPLGATFVIPRTNATDEWCRPCLSRHRSLTRTRGQADA